MRRVEWPAQAKIRNWSLNVTAHSRGAGGMPSHPKYGRGSGAYFAGSLQIVPMSSDDALDFQGFLHSLRGRGGSFVLSMPSGNDLTSLLSRYTDTTYYTDDTFYSDYLAAEAGALAAAGGADGETVDIGSLSASDFVTPGAFLRIGEIELGQLVQIVSIAGNVATIRPRLRFPFPIGTAVYAGRVAAEFRLDQTVPPLPLTGFRSKDFELAIREVRADEEHAAGAGAALLMLIGV